MSEVAYAARVLEKVETRPGCWHALRVGVFDGDQQIGEYRRNYSSLLSTFCPFRQGDRWFALYSRDYMYTRVMSLPDCTDLGGEDSTTVEYRDHFCPMEYHVPELCGWANDPADPRPVPPNHQPDVWALQVALPGGGWRYYWPDDPQHPAPDEARQAAYLAARVAFMSAADAWDVRNPIVTRHAAWGFVGGCVWGDDSSTKVQFLDLSRVAEGVIKRDDRFGYLELPRGVSLKDAVDTESIHDLNAPPERHAVTFAVPKMFTLAGKPVGD